MYRLQKSFIALIGVVVVVGVLAVLMPLVGLGQDQGHAQPPFAMRRFYLTQTMHNPSQAPSACAEGYHMASLWEIFDTSNLRYNTQLGVTTGDSGFGPPSVEASPPFPGFGWIRTGGQASNIGIDGQGNCNGWMNNTSSGFGSAGGLTNEWFHGSVVVVSPWHTLVARCDNTLAVWCVQD